MFDKAPAWKCRRTNIVALGIGCELNFAFQGGFETGIGQRALCKACFPALVRHY